jgi:ribonuclease Z
VTQLRLIGFFIVAGIAAAGWVMTCAAWRADRVMAGVVPLDPRSFPALTVVTVGTGGAYENPDRLGPAIGVALGEELALVDAGRGVSGALRAAGIPVAQPDTVYLTSLLPENPLGLDDLLLTGWLTGRTQPLRVVGPPGTRELVEGLAASHAAGVRARAEALGLPLAGARFEAVEAGPGWSESRGELAVRAGALPGGPLPALAWRFEAGGRAVVVAPVGWAPDALVEFTRGAQTLVHEAAFVPDAELAAKLALDVDPERLTREAGLHTALDSVGELATRAGVETLVLVRLRPPPVYDLQITSLVDDSFAGRIVIPDDGDEITP